MNVQEAKIVASQLTAKVNAGGILTEEEQIQKTEATTTLLEAAETNKPGSTDRIRAQVNGQLNDRVPAGKVRYLGLTMSPALKMMASSLTYIGVAALGAFGGVKYEQRRNRKAVVELEGRIENQAGLLQAAAEEIAAPTHQPIPATARGRSAIIVH